LCIFGRVAQLVEQGIENPFLNKSEKTNKST